MDQPFTILEHPADIGVEAHGKTLAEAVEHAVSGLMSVILDLSTVAVKGSKTLTLAADDREQLIVRFLTEVLYQFDGVGFVTKRAAVNVLSDTHIDATLHGEPFDPARHTTLLDVKAITYHQLAIEEGEEETALVRVFLDI